MNVHNHEDPADRSDTCPACARADVMLSDGDDRDHPDDPVFFDHETGTVASPTAGRPAVAEPVTAEPEPAESSHPAKFGRPGQDEGLTSTHIDSKHTGDPEEPIAETNPAAGRPAVEVGQTAMISLDEILDDPADNIARGCAPIGDTPKFRRLVESLKEHGQQQPIRVRPLVPPVGKQRYRTIFGFRRIAAARLLGWKEIEAKVVEADDTAAMMMNWAEGNRADAGDYAIAMGLVACKRKGFSVAAAAKEIGWQEGDALMHINIIEKCPKELLDIFRVDSSKKTVLLLERISLIESPSPEDTKMLQMDEWNNARTVEMERYQPPKPKPKRKVSEKTIMSARKMATLRRDVVSAVEWYDPLEGFKQITEEQRAFAEAVFRAFFNGVRPQLR